MINRYVKQYKFLCFEGHRSRSCL